MVFFGGAGSAGGWSGGGGGMGGNLRPNSLKRSTDGWDDDELGSVYSHRVVTRMAKMIAPYRFRLFLAVVGVLGFATMTRISVLAVSGLIGAATDGDMDRLNRWGLAYIAMAVLSAAFFFIQMTSTGWIGHRLLLRLRKDMFAHLQKLSLRFYDNNEVGRVMSRITSDVTSLQELMTGGMLTILGDVVGIAISVGVLLYFDVRLTLVTFTVVPVLVVTMAVWQAYSRRAFVRVRQAIAVVNANLQENVSGVRVIQSLSREDENAKRFDNINRQNLNANVNAGLLSAAVTPAVEVIVATATALVVAYGGYRVMNGHLAVEGLVGFALALQMLFDPVRDLVLQYTQLQRAMAGGERVLEVLDTKPEFEDDPNAIDIEDISGRVDFNHVSFNYVDDVQVLADLDLHVEPGETIALVGQTGAGKTTITALISRFYDVTSGSIEVDGIDVRKITHASLAHRMGIVLQEPFLFSGTVYENIRYGRPDATDEEIREAAETVGAHDFISRLEEGYGTYLHERGMNLSVGQRQLISFARAILARPRILILDEATANVDTQTEVVIQRALNTLLAGRTSFVIAHRLSTIRNADRIIVLEHGRIVEQGKHDDLLALGGRYARLYRMTYEQHALSSSANGDGARAGSSGNGHGNGHTPALKPAADPAR
ncbi:MAG: ABC transporter ATP-binding protein [Chloroflexi bacterium]|nr:ABC transporter ATP-binding protein [Chloroflexota bacterium]